MSRESRQLKRELKELERDAEFLNDSRKRMEHILGDLGTFAHCNMYANYTELKIKIQDEMGHFYDSITSQFNSSIDRCEKAYLEAVHKDALEKISASRAKRR